MAIIPAVGVGVVVTNVVITYNEYFSHFIIQCSPIPDFSASVQEKTGNWVANSDLSEITLLNTIFSGRKGKMYYFRIKSVGTFGNESSWSSTQSEIAGDITPPQQILPIHVNISLETLTITSTLNSSYPYEPDLSYFEWWKSTSSTLPSGATPDQVGHRSFSFTGNLRSRYYIYVRATDTSGNQSYGHTTPVGSKRIFADPIDNSIQNWSDIIDDDSNKPDDNATIGATWGTDISNEPISLNDINTSQYTDLVNADSDLDTIIAGPRGSGTGVSAINVIANDDATPLFNSSDQMSGDLIGDVYDSTGANVLLDTTNKYLKSNAGVTLIDLAEASAEGKMTGNLWVTGVLNIGSSLTGQRIKIDGTNNDLIFFNSSNNQIIRLDDNIFASLPGMEIYDGVIYLRESAGNDFFWVKSGSLLLNSEENSYPVSISSEQEYTADAVSRSISGLVSDISSNTYGKERYAVTGLSTTSNGTNTCIPIGVAGTATAVNASVEAIGLLGTSDDIALRLATDLIYTDYCDFKIDINGYLDINPSGSRVTIDGYIRAGYDTDLASYFGRAAIGFASYTDNATFAHIDRNTAGNYALLQSGGGTTRLNSSTGQELIFAQNNTTIAKFQATGNDFEVLNQIVNDDIVYPEITVTVIITGTDVELKVDFSKLNDVSSGGIGDGNGVGGKDTRGGLTWWVGTTAAWGDPVPLPGAIGVGLDNGNNLDPSSPNLEVYNHALTDGNGVFQLNITSSGSAGLTTYYFHAMIQDKTYVESFQVYTSG